MVFAPWKTGGVFFDSFAHQENIILFCDILYIFVMFCVILYLHVITHKTIKRMVLV